MPTSAPIQWTTAARAVASLLIATYIVAVVLPPLAGPPPASALANRALQPFRPLVGALYLGHGYRFFAPDPGPGHSIRWIVERADGSQVSGSLPDRLADRPRLLYHRRFMIPEKIAPLVPPSDAPDEVRRAARADWLPLVKGLAGQLLERHDGARVELALVEHYLPAPEELIAAEQGGGGDPDTMADIVTPLGTFALAEAVLQ
ncbi:MAG: hypothetical protein EBR28_10410 [Planctomycetia bacterium]|nr:hypothetical protein [Planctomycetia bacterium]